MDFFPDLGEPGLWDEIFYFGPFVLQVILGVFFFSLSGRWLVESEWRLRILSAIVMLFLTNLVLLGAFIVVFNLANP